jgi:hypothetical protein
MTTYTTYQKEIKGNVFRIITAKGTSNYVNVTKVTNNPYRGMGKDFKDFNHAQNAYKCADLKLFILEVEMGLRQAIN